MIPAPWLLLMVARAFVSNAQARIVGKGEFYKPIRRKGDGEAQLVAIKGHCLGPSSTIENGVDYLWR